MKNIEKYKLKPLKTACSNRQSQKGVVLIITLIALVIILLASVALVRSTDTNLLIAGNLAFKRDLVNNGDSAIANIRQIFSTGAMGGSTAKESNVTAQNYFAHIQASNAIGIPNILLDKTTFDATYSAQNLTYPISGVEVRYVVDRMCIAPTAGSTTSPLNVNGCSIYSADAEKGGDAHNPKPGSAIRGIYRISMRISGPRGTEAFMQSTFAI